jgi:RNA polymerase sigma-70 factor (ECF subfamily)
MQKIEAVNNFEKFVAENNHRLRCAIYHIGIFREEDVEDILQDTYLSLFSALPHLKDDTNIVGYSIVTALNKARTYRRRENIREIPLETIIYPLGYENFEEREIERIEAADKLVEVLNNPSLTPIQREILIFKAKESTYQEIAEDLNIPIGKVKSRLNRARERLKTAALTNPQN